MRRGCHLLKSVKVDMPKMAGNLMCRAMPGQAGATAAQVIAAVGKACDVSPQVILVMLQKEQTLVTGRTPYSGESVSLIYRKATGSAAPTPRRATRTSTACSTSCTASPTGSSATRRRRARPARAGPATAGSPSASRAASSTTPSAACGAKTVTIRTRRRRRCTTTRLRPERGRAVRRLGIGNSCSAYGNRNFYLYFTTWFGSTHYVVTGAINTYWSAHKSTYGDPAGNAVKVSANGGGTYQRFAKGTISTSFAGTFARPVP